MLNIGTVANTNVVSYLVARIDEVITAMDSIVVTTDSNTTSGNAVVNGVFQSVTLVANAIGGSATISANGSIGAAANLNITTMSVFAANVYMQGGLLSITGNLSGTNATLTGNTAANNVAITGSFSANTLTLTTSLAVGNLTLSSANTTLVANGQYFLNANNSWVYIPSLWSNGSVTTTGTSAQVIDSFTIGSGFTTSKYIFSIKDNTANNFKSGEILLQYDGGAVLTTEYGVLVSNTDIGAFFGLVNTTHIILNFTPTPANTTVKFARVLI